MKFDSYSKLVIAFKVIVAMPPIIILLILFLTFYVF